MAVPQVLRETEEKMKRAVDAVAREFATVRTGRASSALVEGISIDYFGTPTPLKHMASIATPEPRLIVIQPWDVSALQAIEKGIQKSELGLSPVIDGKVIRITVPPLTAERRVELDRLVRKMAEDGRISVRTVRRDANEHAKQLQKEGKASEDGVFRAQDEIQKLTDRYTQRIDQSLKEKEKELTEI